MTNIHEAAKLAKQLLPLTEELLRGPVEDRLKFRKLVGQNDLFALVNQVAWLQSERVRRETALNQGDSHELLKAIRTELLGPSEFDALKELSKPSLHSTP